MIECTMMSARPSIVILSTNGTRIARGKEREREEWEWKWMWKQKQERERERERENKEGKKGATIGLAV